ncbi:MAG: hypothetical protein H6905_00045 [Hyphomicrobiales bacterium]|nr:hypothetical protein [Hyphomicrobiales bacterium]
MTTPSAGAGAPPRRFKRIMIAFDWGSESVRAVEEATDLAVRLHAELRAMFVEDVDLLRLSEHANVHAFRLLSLTGQQLAAGQLRQEMRARVARSRRALEEAAARRRLKCAFEVRQGHALSEALEAATDEDLVIVSWSPQLMSGSWGATRPPPAALAHALSEAHGRSVLLLHPDAPKAGPILIGFDGSDQAKTALGAALQIADDQVSELIVVLLSNRLAEIDRWSHEIKEMTADSTSPLRIVHMPMAGLAELCHLARNSHARLLVFGANLVLAQGDMGRQALGRVSCSVLLTR